MKQSIFLASMLVFMLTSTSRAADFIVHSQQITRFGSTAISVKGHVTVIDGGTLWFPAGRVLVRLANIDTCELVQWSFDPQGTTENSPALAPVPCGAMAKAWLKRTIGLRTVKCDIEGHLSVETRGVCTVGGRDLGLEMLRVGWAKLAPSSPTGHQYRQAQQAAFAARYGMWATYVLDMEEWRESAVDRTLGRRPEADRNLLSKRRSEISPPFFDARQQPRRRDR